MRPIEPRPPSLMCVGPIKLQCPGTVTQELFRSPGLRVKQNGTTAPSPAYYCSGHVVHVGFFEVATVIGNSVGGRQICADFAIGLSGKPVHPFVAGQVVSEAGAGLVSQI